VAATLGSLILWTDRLFLGAMRTSSDVGVYQAATQVAMLFLVVMGAVAAIFTPMIARLYHEKQLERLRVLYRISTKWTLYLCLPIAVLVFAGPTNVVTTVFGPEYAAAAVPVMILTTAQLVNVGTGSVGYLLIMTGRQRAWMSVSAISFGLNVVLNAALIPRWGAPGAALATGVAVSVLFILGLILVVRLIGLWPYDFSYAKGLVAFGTATIACSWRDAPPTVGGVFVSLVISTVVFAGTLWLLGLNNEDRQVIGIALERARLR
jgi:O-antigen/teichoic acid export membrane protein